MRRCPICRERVSAPAYRPFCSKRCADIDLGRWFSGRYVVPGAEDVDDSAPPPVLPLQGEEQGAPSPILPLQGGVRGGRRDD